MKKVKKNQKLITDRKYTQYPKRNTSLANKLQQFLFAKLDKNEIKVKYSAGYGN